MFITDQKRCVIFDMRHYIPQLTGTKIVAYVKTKDINVVNLLEPFLLGEFKSAVLAAQVLAEIKMHMRDWRRTQVRELYRIPIETKEVAS